MTSNRDRLRRTRDGRYEVGVYIEKDKYARFVAQVLVPVDAPESTVTQLAKKSRPTGEAHCTGLTPTGLFPLLTA